VVYVLKINIKKIGRLPGTSKEQVEILKKRGHLQERR